MKVKVGDVLVCACDDCKVELTVTKARDWINAISNVISRQNAATNPWN